MIRRYMTRRLEQRRATFTNPFPALEAERQQHERGRWLFALGLLGAVLAPLFVLGWLS